MTRISLPLCLSALALSLVLYSAWLPAKAWLAHALIKHSWQQKQRDGGQFKPWPWADMHAIASLKLARLNQEIIVLQGADPSSLAFSAGAMHGYSELNRHSPVVIAGHKDSHFSFLQDILMKDVISLTNTKGINQLYQVENIDIIDTADTDIVLAENQPNLILITCYPFDSSTVGGTMRYVITAKRLGESE